MLCMLPISMFLLLSSFTSRFLSFWSRYILELYSELMDSTYSFLLL